MATAELTSFADNIKTLGDSIVKLTVLDDNAIWQGLRAVRQGRVFLADGNAFFNRPGPRLVESAEILAEILHPDVCNFGHRGRQYVPYEGEHTPKRKKA